MHIVEKGKGDYQKVIRKEVSEEDGVVGHKRYVNLARFLNKPYNPGNIGSA